MESCVGNLKKQLQCSSCNDMLIDPKIVDCFHVFCKQCIKRNALGGDKKNYIFKCPNCDSKTLLQDLNDVEDLQTSPVHSRILKALEFVQNRKVCSVSSSHPEALRQCLDCDRSLCEECFRCHSAFFTNHQVLSLSDLKKENMDMLLKKEPPCKTHGNPSVEFYCEDCKMLICTVCMKEHHNHKTMTLKDIIAIEKYTLSRILEQIDKISSNKEEKKQQQEIAQALKRDGAKAKQQVKELTEKFIKALRSNEHQLLNRIQESITKAEKNLRIISHTAQAQEYIKFFIENSTASEMINIQYDESSQNFTYKPFDEAVFGVEFKPDEDLCKQMEHDLGRVQVLKKADPTKSSVKVVSSGVKIEASKKAKLVLEIKTSKVEVAQEHLENLTIQFTPKDDVKVGEIQMTEGGKIVVDFVPSVPGQLTADIKIHGNHVCRSPLVMQVEPLQICFMTAYSKLKDALNRGSKSYTGITVNMTNSRIAVADGGQHCVRVYNMEGDLLLTYGSYGRGQGKICTPQGLEFLNETDLVIVDSGNKRICIVDTNAKQLLRTFGCDDNGNGQFPDHPSGVHVDGDSHIMVCYQSSSRVQVFTKDGAYLYHFTTSKPNYIMIHNGLFYVSDNNIAVNVIEIRDNQSPATLTTIGNEKWAADGKLKSLRGLAVDNDGNLLVCTNWYDRGNPSKDGARFIYKFTLDGRYVGRSTELSSELCYIAVLNSGQVVCTTTGQGVLFLDN